MDVNIHVADGMKETNEFLLDYAGKKIMKLTIAKVSKSKMVVN
jgi:hypothetical protein